MAGTLDVGTLLGHADLKDDLTPKLRVVESAVQNAVRKLAGLGDESSNTAVKLQAMGRFTAMAGDRLTFLMAPIGIATGAIIKMGTSFEKEMTKVVTVAGVSRESMEQMREEILKLGPAVGRGPEELAKGLYGITSVGMRGAEAMQILERSAKASAVGLGETGDVSRAVVAAMTAYGKETLSAATATDMLLAAVREGGAEADQFANTLGRVVGTASQVGISYSEVLASISTFTRLGVRADEAVTALRGTMALLMKPTAGAREELQNLGTSIGQLRDKVKKDGLADALIELVQLAGANEDSLGRIIPNVRALAGVLGNTGHQAQAYRDVLKEIQNSHGDLDEAFKETTKTAAFMKDQFFATLETIAVKSNLSGAFAAMLKSIEPIIALVGKLVDAFTMLPGPIQSVATVLFGMTLAAGPLMSFGGRFIEIVGMLTGPKALGALIPKLAEWTKGLRDVESATKAVTAATEVQAAVTAASPLASGSKIASAVGTSAGAGVVAKQAVQSSFFFMDPKTVDAETAALKRVTEAGNAAALAAMNAARAKGAWGTALDAIGNKAAAAAEAQMKITMATEAAVAASAATSLAAREALQNATQMSLGLDGVVTQTVKTETWMVKLGNAFAAVIPWIKTLAEWLSRGVAFIGGWPVAIGALVGSLILGTDGFKSLGSMVKSSMSILTSFASDTLGLVGAKLQEFGRWLVNTVPGIEAVSNAVGGLRNILALAADTLDRLAGEAAKGRWGQIADFFSVALPPWMVSFLKTLDEYNSKQPKANDIQLKMAPKSYEELALDNPPEFLKPQTKDPFALDALNGLGVQKDFLGRVRLGIMDTTAASERLKKEIGTLKDAFNQPIKADVAQQIRDLAKYADLSPDKIVSKLAQTGVNVTEASVKRVLADQKEIQNGIKKTTKDLEEQQEALNELHTIWDLTPTDKGQVEFWLMQEAPISRIAKALGLNVDAVQNYSDSLKRNQKNAEDWVDLQQQMALTTRKLSAETTQQANELQQKAANATIVDQTRMIQEYGHYQNEMSMIGLGESARRLRQIEIERRGALDAVNGTHQFAMMMRGIIEAYYAYLTAEEKRLAELEKRLTNLRAITEGFKTLGSAIMDAVGDPDTKKGKWIAAIGSIVAGVGQLTAAWENAIRMQEEYRRRGYGMTGSERAGALISGAGAVIGATNQGTTQQRAINGAIAGASAGMAFGPMGAVVGGVIGFTAGLIRGGLALTEYQKRVRAAHEELLKLRKEVLNTEGGLNKLVMAGRVVQVIFEKAWNASDPELLKATIDEIQKKMDFLTSTMEKYGLSWADAGEDAKLYFATVSAQKLIDEFNALVKAGFSVQTAIGGMAKATNSWLTEALRAGVGIPAAMRPMIESLIRTGQITRENAELMLGLRDTSVPSLDKIREAADKYGVSLDSLGPKVAQLAFTELADSIADDLATFTGAGVDIGRIWEIMGDEIQDLINKSLRFGYELPDSMRPFIQAMIEAGRLVDENGDKLTDISKIKFTVPLEQLIDQLITKLDALITKFLELAGIHLPPINVPYTLYPTNDPSHPSDPRNDPSSPEYNRDNEPESGKGPYIPGPSAPMAAGGDFIVRQPTLFEAGEAGIERVRFAGAGHTEFPGEGGGGDYVQNITVMLPEGPIVRTVLRGLPKDAKITGVVRR